MMQDKDLAREFNNDLDAMLKGHRPADADAACSSLVDTAWLYSQADFSDAPGVKERVKRRYYERQKHSDEISYHFIREVSTMFKIIASKPAYIALSLGLVLVIGAGLIFPGTLTAIGSDAYQGIVKIIQVSPYATYIQTDDSSGMPAPNPSADDSAVAPTSDAPGDVTIIASEMDPPESAGTIHHQSVEAARNAVDFDFSLPTYLPEGYSFKEATSYEGSGLYLNVHYSGPGRNIELMLRKASEETAFVSSSNAEIQTVDINGNPGVVVTPHDVEWEMNQVGYTLIGHSVDQDELMKIARSCR